MSEEFVPLSPSLSELSSTSTSTLVQMLPNGDIVDCACLPGTARNTLYKTERCKHFDKTGVCKYGDKCQFAHGGNELRSVLRHPKYKTTLCKAFATKGKCLYGSRCRFIHQKMNDYIREHPDEISSIIYPEESFMLSDETNLSEDTASTSGESDTKDSRSNDALQFTDASLKSSKDTFCNSKFSSYDIRSASPVDGNGKNNFSTYLNNNFYNEKTISIDSIYATFDYAEDEEKNSEPLHIEFDFLKDNIESINTATILPINETTSISTSISTLPSLTSTSTSMKTIFNHSLFINPQSYTIESINNQKKLTTRLSVFDQIYHVNDLTL